MQLRSPGRLSLLVLSLLLPLKAGYAQTVDLRLLNDSGTTRIPGAIVRLLGSSGAPVQGLTDELGRLVLRAPGPGTYRLKIDRIGWSGLVTDPFQLEPGQVLHREIRLESRRIALPPLVVSGRNSCGSNPQTGDLASALWDEVRKALTANLLTEQSKAVPIHVREFVREVDLHSQPLREWVVVSRLTRGGSFTSLPVPDLVRNGFVQQSGDSLVFAAPDAAAMLADEFVASHCFHAVADANGLAGLAFVPVRGRRVPDVSGTLWLDRASSELRSLEYRYTGLERDLADARLGGRVEFLRLPAGQWIVSYWHVRMPRMVSHLTMQDTKLKPELVLSGYFDRGGRANVALDTLGRVDRAVIRGRVYDSTVSAGLAGAVLRVVGTADSVLSDADGRFELAVAASGDQRVTAQHAKLGLLGEPTSRNVLLSLGDTTEVQFAVPALARFVKALCPNRPNATSIFGMAWSTKGDLAGNRDVRAYDSSPRRREQGRTKSSARGFYSMCGLPHSGSVQLVSADSGNVLVEVPVELNGGQRWIDLRDWGSADTTTAPLKLIAKLPAEPVLLGVVRNEAKKPVSGVEVIAEGTDSHATTDSAGRFLLAGLPAGNQFVLFRAIGWKPLRLNVNLTEGDTTRTEARMVAEGVVLAPITVTEAPKAPRGVGFEAFEERRKLGFGKFLDSLYLERHENQRLDALLEATGVWIKEPPDCPNPADCRPYRGFVVALSSRPIRIHGGERCLMQVVLDGVVVSRGGDIGYDQAYDLNLLPVHSLKAVEVYRSAGEIPAEFNNTRAACGVLVLWTKP